MSYCCDRGRSVTWGLEGGLPSIPHGVWFTRHGDATQYLGAVFSNVPIGEGDTFDRPSAGGGGFGDPLDRDPGKVLEDVIDGYVSLQRAVKDYGVIVREIDPNLDQYDIDIDATEQERKHLRGRRRNWLDEDPGHVAEMYRQGEVDMLDAVRRYAVVLDWGAGELLPKTTATFRDMVHRRSASYWRTPVGTG